ncbi:hypothetical protein ACN6LA_001451, partial [Streptomyces sp. SAS_269]|uniref:hypothetical protein n=1 Tax=Streptomyces sp. SAS_269 TaxID=3412749 RepID=UPI00403C9CB1
ARDGRSGRTAAPEPRSRSGVPGRRSSRTGTEPVTARSALRLRLPLFAAATAALAVRAPARSDPGDSPGSGALTVLALIRGVRSRSRRRRTSPS